MPNELYGNIQQAVETHMQSIVRVAYTYVKSVHDAEDIAQDTFLSYMHAGKAFESAEHEKAWLIRVCINKAKNSLKSGWFKSRNPLPEDLSAEMPEENGILQAVMQLEEKYRLPIHLFYYEGYDITEIAKLLSIPSGTVGTRLARARKALKTMLGGEYFEG